MPAPVLVSVPAPMPSDVPVGMPAKSCGWPRLSSAQASSPTSSELSVSDTPPQTAPETSSQSRFFATSSSQSVAPEPEPEPVEVTETSIPEQPIRAKIFERAENHEPEPMDTSLPENATVAARAVLVNDMLAEGDFLVFDTETTGLRGDAIVIQLAYILCSADGATKHEYSHYWHTPDGRAIPWPAFKVHGIGKSTLTARGVSAPPEIAAFQMVVKECHRRGVVVLAHNVDFDVRLLRQTAGVFNIPFALLSSRMLCTMARSKDKAGFKDVTGRRARNPKNAELYEKLLGHAPTEKLHDALGDVRVTGAVYVAAKNRRWW